MCGSREGKGRLDLNWLDPASRRLLWWSRLYAAQYLQGKTQMMGRLISAPVKERLDRIRRLRREIEELILTDAQGRLPGGVVCWTDRKKHEARLDRINEIKQELTVLLGTKRVL